MTWMLEKRMGVQVPAAQLKAVSWSLKATATLPDGESPQMDWSTYERKYYIHDLAQLESLVAIRISRAILRDFPKSLPDEWADRFAQSEQDFSNALNAVASGVDPHQRIPWADILSRVPDTFEDIAPGFLATTLEAYGAFFNLGIPKSEVKFGEGLAVQQLLMTFAHLESFTSETIRTICQVKPAVLKSSRTIEWTTVVESSSRDDLLANLTDQLVFHYSIKSFRDRMARLIQDFGLEINIPPRVLLALEGAELVRNVFAHNNGAVSNQFLAKAKRLRLQLDEMEVEGPDWIGILFSDLARPVEIGDELRVHDDVADKVSEYSRTVAGELFIAVSDKFFGKSREDITGVQYFSP